MGAPNCNINVSGDPKYQVKVFNGKPQFRIRKRNESAKVSKPIGVRKGNSFKQIEQSTSGTIEHDDEGIYEETGASSYPRFENMDQRDVIGKIQAKYGLGKSQPNGSKTRKRKIQMGWS